MVKQKKSRLDGQELVEAREQLRKAENILSGIHFALELVQDANSSDGGMSFYEKVSRFEAVLIKAALRHTGGSQTKAARLLGLKPTTLHTKINLYDIAINDFKRIQLLEPLGRTAKSSVEAKSQRQR